MINLSFVIPVYNEEATIKELLANISSTCLASSIIDQYEIIVVDDSSSDNTNKILKEISEIKLIKNLNNSGYGYSLKTGIKQTKYDDIVIIDGDGTYPIKYLDKLLEKYNLGYDLVIGKRTGKNLNSSLFKKIMRSFLKAIVEFSTGKKIADINSGFRIIKKKKILNKLNHLSNSFSFTTSMTMSFIYSFYSIGYVDIPYALRNESSSSKVNLFKDSLRTLQYIIKVILFYDAIKLFVLISFFQVVLFLILLIGSFFNDIFLIPSVLILISAIICFCIGLLSEKHRTNEN